MMMRSAITTKKMKFESVSNPSQLEKTVRGSGKRAIKRKTMGNRSHAMEFLIEIVFFFNDTIIIINNIIVAIDISI